MIPNLPKHITKQMTDKDRAFINKMEKTFEGMGFSKRWDTIGRYEIVWCGVIWKMSTEKNLKLRKVFKQLEKELGEDYEQQRL